MNLKLVAMTLGLAVSSSAVVLDRIAASVGKQLILESEVTRYLRVAAFLDQKPADLKGESKRRATERLVDQLLMVREAAENRVVLPSDQDGDRLLADARTLFASPEQYQDTLRLYQVSEQDVRTHLLAGYRMLRFTDLRFRPEVQVTEEELADFYQILAAGWRRSQNGAVPTFEQSRDEVERLLMDQKSIQKLDTWLSSARVLLGVSYRERVFE